METHGIDSGKIRGIISICSSTTTFTFNPHVLFCFCNYFSTFGKGRLENTLVCIKICLCELENTAHLSVEK